MEEKQQFKTVSEFVAHLEGMHDNHVGRTYVIETLKEITVRPSNGTRRGQLAGLALEDMDDEQLKREIINSKSVLYKAQQRGASPETIEKNQARVDAAMAEKAKRTPVAETPATDAVEGTDTAEAVYNDEVANEL